MILTVGGDAASKGAQEVMQALALTDTEAPNWRYVCKVWPQPRTVQRAGTVSVFDWVTYDPELSAPTVWAER